ncbi:MAG TPA: hypothetical protein VHQ43_12360 [Solirubrobacterales bacterium]|nr:hypothetical protein [Solirubrobacterales bacterium]
MGKLIATTQATVDGVIDPIGDWAICCPSRRRSNPNAASACCG